MGRTLDDKRRKKENRNSNKKQNLVDYSIESQIGDCENTIYSCEHDLQSAMFSNNLSIQRKLKFAKEKLAILTQKLNTQKEVQNGN